VVKKLNDHNNMGYRVEHGDYDLSDGPTEYTRNLVIVYGYGFTPLILALQARDTDLIKVLIDAGANVNTPDNLGLTPLFHASHSHAGTVMLINAGANVNAVDLHGHPSLVHAAIMGYTATVKLLIEAGAIIKTEIVKYVSPQDTATLKVLNDAIDTYKQEIVDAIPSSLLREKGLRNVIKRYL
jgi:ankyrin repeat protein